MAIKKSDLNQMYRDIEHLLQLAKAHADHAGLPDSSNLYDPIMRRVQQGKQQLARPSPPPVPPVRPPRPTPPPRPSPSSRPLPPRRTEVRPPIRMTDEERAVLAGARAAEESELPPRPRERPAPVRSPPSIWKSVFGPKEQESAPPEERALPERPRPAPPTPPPVLPPEHEGVLRRLLSEFRHVVGLEGDVLDVFNAWVQLLQSQHKLLEKIHFSDWYLAQGRIIEVQKIIRQMREDPSAIEAGKADLSNLCQYIQEDISEFLRTLESFSQVLGYCASAEHISRAAIQKLTALYEAALSMNDQPAAREIQRIITTLQSQHTTLQWYVGQTRAIDKEYSVIITTVRDLQRAITVPYLLPKDDSEPEIVIPKGGVINDATEALQQILDKLKQDIPACLQQAVKDRDVLKEIVKRVKEEVKEEVRREAPSVPASTKFKVGDQCIVISTHFAYKNPRYDRGRLEEHRRDELGVILQGPESDGVSNWWLVQYNNGETGWVDEIRIAKTTEAAAPVPTAELSPDDEILYQQAVTIVRKTRKVSASGLQRGLRIGYNEAARFVDRMEREGLIGPSDGVRLREVLMPAEGAAGPEPSPEPSPAEPISTKFKVGDWVNVKYEHIDVYSSLGRKGRRQHLGRLVHGTIGQVISGPGHDVDKLISWQVQFTNGTTGWVFEAYIEKTSSPAEPILSELPKFKAGDVVRLVGDYGVFKAGDVGKVDQSPFESAGRVVCAILSSDGRKEYVPVDRLEKAVLTVEEERQFREGKAQREEALQLAVSTFKAGDVVRLVRDYRVFKAGDVGEVVERPFESAGRVVCAILSSDGRKEYVPVGDLEKATPL
ncbi:hypothetical protein HYU19_05665 [Candidatus Woesearchaeota archaeon]|nr:hypothetical protein [Candidatus Woesearchaeota archaeon]